MNGTMLQGFSWYLSADGSHWRRLAEQAPTFAYEGITAVWMPPAYKGEHGAEDVGYGVYDLYDLGEFDQKGSVGTKYGTRTEYEAAIEALHANGIQALADIVLNQKLGADACEDVVAREVQMNDRNAVAENTQTISAWTRFTFPGRAGTYSDFTWDWTCFHGVDWDDKAKRKALFLFDGKHWDASVDHTENANFDYLMGADVDVNDPRVYEELVRWGTWYADACKLDGFRLDALKHIDRDFYLRWLAAMREHAGRELFCVGEYWKDGIAELDTYLGQERALSLFDVPLHYHLYQASCSNGTFDLSKIFAGSGVAVVLTGRDGGEKRMFVGSAHAGETWTCVVGEQDDVAIDAEGWDTFHTFGGRLSVYLPEKTADALEHDRELHRIVRETADDTEELRA